MNKNENKEVECKSCRYCDPYINLCVIKWKNCYSEGKCLSENCTHYIRGDYFIVDAVMKPYEEGK